MKLSIIVPNYNGEELLKSNLPKVIEAIQYYCKKENTHAQVIIVDDASRDNSIEFLESKQSILKTDKVSIEILKNEKNLGFSSTINRGVKKADGDIVVLLNSDVVPEKEFLSPLLSHFRDQLVFAVGCMDKSIEGNQTILRGRGVGFWKRGFLIHSRGETNKTDTLWVSGGSSAFRKNIWNKLEGFDELFNPFYWEDIDLSYRAQKAGYSIRFEPRSVVYHKHDTGAIKKQYTPFQVKTIAYRNQFIFIWKNITDLNFQLLHVVWLPVHFLRALLRQDLSFYSGFGKAFLKLPQVIKKSFIAQKQFRKKDKDILDSFSDH
jgi:GT2 family glycosyltransferase